MLGPLPTTAGSGFEPQHLPKTTTFLFKCVHVLERERERGHEHEMCMCVCVYHGAYVTELGARCVCVCGFTMEHT